MLVYILLTLSSRYFRLTFQKCRLLSCFRPSRLCLFRSAWLWT